MTQLILRELNNEPARECSKCGILKTLREGFNKSRNGVYGYFSWCKQCCLEDKRSRGYREVDLRKNFDMTLEEYNKILESQNGVCAICKQPELAKRNLAVDHCHETDEVRGLLCTKCNTAIGLLNEDEAIIRNLLEYLNKFKISNIC